MINNSNHDDPDRNNMSGNKVSLMGPLGVIVAVVMIALGIAIILLHV